MLQVLQFIVKTLLLALGLTIGVVVIIEITLLIMGYFWRKNGSLKRKVGIK